MQKKIQRCTSYLNKKAIYVLTEVIEFLDITRLLIEIVGLVFIYLVFASGNLAKSLSSNEKKSNSNFWKL